MIGLIGDHSLPFLRQQKGDAASEARRRGFMHPHDDALNPLRFPLGHRGGGMWRSTLVHKGEGAVFAI